MFCCTGCHLDVSHDKVIEGTATMNSSNQENYDQLIQQLEEESSSLSPMLLSEVYLEVVAQKDSILPSLISSVKDTTVKHYLTLMAIGEIMPDALHEIPGKTRIKIYVDALQKGKPNNDWGLAGEYLSGASLDLINIGEAAIPPLIPLLSDTTKTSMWGSEEVTINQHYQNRVCDFTYYLILHLVDRKEPYDETPAERDQAIERLKQTLSPR